MTFETFFQKDNFDLNAELIDLFRDCLKTGLFVFRKGFDLHDQ